MEEAYAIEEPERVAIRALEVQRRAAFKRVLMGLLVLNILPLAATVGQSVFSLGAVLSAYGTIGVTYFLAIFLYRRDHLKASAHVIAGGLFLVSVGCVLFMGGVNSLLSVSFLTVTIIASLTAGAGATAIYATLSGAAFLGVYWLEQAGHLPEPLYLPSDVDLLSTLLTALVTAGFLLQRGIREFESALVSTKESERSHLSALQTLERTQEMLLNRTQRDHAVRDLSEHLLTTSEPSEIAALIRDVIERSFPNVSALYVGFDRIRGRLVPLEPLASLGRVWLDDDSEAKLHAFLLSEDPTAQLRVRDEEGSPLRLLVHNLASNSGAAPHGLIVIELPAERELELEEALLNFTLTIARVLRSALDRLQAERGLRESQRIEALGRLSGGVAHDFNNLLTVILGASEVLKRRVDESSAVLVHEIMQTSHKASELTRQLLAFSSRDAVESTLLDVDEVIVDLTRILKRLLGSNITLDLELNSGGRQLLADRAGLEQVLLNLAVNARDAMPRGGRIAISTSIECMENLSRAEAVEYLALAVADEGVGMSEEIRARLFEPFFTTKAADQGTGLGLSTVYGIVNGLGGQIEIDSTPGKGSNFRCLFPIGVKEIRRSDKVPIDRASYKSEESGITPRTSGSESA